MMTERGSEHGAAWWSQNLEEVDREVARLATLCRARILDPGVIERVLQNDTSVCGTANQLAFDKLRTALQMHYHLRASAAGAVGEAKAAALVKQTVERLRVRFGGQLGDRGPQ
jgi:hypothetical protein